MPTPRSTLPTPASSRKPSASEQRVRRIAKEVEDNSFKFSQQPNFGSATVHPRVPRLADLKLLDAGSQSTRSATLPARATASSARAHGIWDRSSILTGMPGWAAEPGSCAGGAEDAEASGLGSKTGAVAAEPKRGMSEPVRVEPPNSWGTPVLVAPTGGSLTARLGASRPGTASQHGGGASARPSSARGGGGGGGGGSARGDKSLQDYAVLAAACRRVGRHRQEALAHFSSGVLHERAGATARAVGCYQKMLGAARESGDLIVQGVGHNHLGCCLQLLGEYERAATAHQAHLDLQLDGGSRHIAHLNLGLAQAALGDHHAAAESQQQALRFAVRSSSLEGESLASANLGLAGYQVGDLDQARACLHRHLQLTEAMQGGGSAEAYARLAQLERDAGNAGAAAECFHSAMESARQTQQQGAFNESKMELGLLQGSLEFDDWMRQIKPEGAEGGGPDA